MATFISISGASTTGKTSLINSLSTYPELKNCIFCPDLQDVVWKELVDAKLFTEFTEITTDSDYLCIYIMKLIDCYHEYIEYLDKDSNSIVFLDSCWLDYSIYSILNMWYNRGIKSVQEEILDRVSNYDDRISRIYITHADDKTYPVDKNRLRGKINTFRANRPLELKYYDIAKHLSSSVPLPSSDVSEASLFIIEDLKNLGYL